MPRVVIIYVWVVSWVALYVQQGFGIFFYLQLRCRLAQSKANCINPRVNVCGYCLASWFFNFSQGMQGLQIPLNEAPDTMSSACGKNTAVKYVTGVKTDDLILLGSRAEVTTTCSSTARFASRALRDRSRDLEQRCEIKTCR
jgi:hypothetical protein